MFMVVICLIAFGGTVHTGIIGVGTAGAGITGAGIAGVGIAGAGITGVGTMVMVSITGIHSGVHRTMEDFMPTDHGGEVAITVIHMAAMEGLMPIMPPEDRLMETLA